MTHFSTILAYNLSNSGIMRIYYIKLTGFVLFSGQQVRFGNSTIGVNLRKGLACSRAIHCASYILKKRGAMNCATTNADILVLCVI